MDLQIEDLERRAAAMLPEHVYDYFRATAKDPDMAISQVAAWDELRHRPHVFRNASRPVVSTSVLGTAVGTPVLIAPMAQQIAATSEAEVATARAAAEAGTLIGVSTNTAVPFPDIAAAGAPWRFQLYVMQDRSLTAALLDRAIAANGRPPR